MFVSGLFILVIWYSNVWNTGYLPINTNKIFDHFGKAYNVSATLDDRGMYDEQKHRQYSDPYIGASNALVYGCFFAVYSALVTHVIIYHRFEIKTGFQSLFKGLRFWRKKTDGNSEAVKDEHLDVHNRLMAAYPEGMDSPGFMCCASDACRSLGMVVRGNARHLRRLWCARHHSLADLYAAHRDPVGHFAVSCFCDTHRHHHVHDGHPCDAQRAGRVHRRHHLRRQCPGHELLQGLRVGFSVSGLYAFELLTTSQLHHHRPRSLLCPRLEDCALRQGPLPAASVGSLADCCQIPPRVTFAGQMLATLISTLVCSSLIKFQVTLPGSQCSGP